MKRSILLVLLSVLASLALLGAEKDAGTGYELENVHVMDKSMRLTEAREYMITFNEALGVQCRDCHDLRDFASDDNELKLVSREMMRMTKEINENWFADREIEVVTCFTCHQGERLPLLDSRAAGLLLPRD